MTIILPQLINLSPPLVPHIQCVVELCNHWFRQWLVAWSAPSHYLNQWWLTISHTPKKWHINLLIIILPPFCPGGKESKWLIFLKQNNPRYSLEIFHILIQILLKFVPGDPIDNNSASGNGYLVEYKPSLQTMIWAHFLSLTRSKLRLCSANHRAGYFSKLACDWLSIVCAYSEQNIENGPSSLTRNLGSYKKHVMLWAPNLDSLDYDLHARLTRQLRIESSQDNDLTWMSRSIACGVIWPSLLCSLRVWFEPDELVYAVTYRTCVLNYKSC